MPSDTIGGGNVERKIFDVIVGRTKNEKINFTRIGTAFENETNIKILFDALPITNSNGEAIVYLKERLRDVSESNVTQKEF